METFEVLAAVLEFSAFDALWVGHVNRASRSL